MAKKLLFLLLLLLAMLSFSTCGKSPTETDGIDTADLAQQSQEGEALIRQSEDRIVSVRIKNGQAEISFNVEEMPESLRSDLEYVGPELYDIKRLQESSFAVETRGTKIVDACIGEIEESDSALLYNTVAFLMEDGTLEYLTASPFIGADSTGATAPVYSSQGKLPWLKSIVSLSYEADKEGVGGKTIYATDKDDLSYNVGPLCGLCTVFDTAWICDLDAVPSDTARYCLSLWLEENGDVTLTKGWYPDKVFETYKGSYEIFLAENSPSGQKSGTISFDLKLDSSVWKKEDKVDIASQIRGVYFVEGFDGGYLKLWFSDGDPLYKENEKQKEEYTFWADSLL